MASKEGGSRSRCLSSTDQSPPPPKGQRKVPFIIGVAGGTASGKVASSHEEIDPVLSSYLSPPPDLSVC